MNTGDLSIYLFSSLSLSLSFFLHMDSADKFEEKIIRDSKVDFVFSVK